MLGKPVDFKTEAAFTQLLNLAKQTISAVPTTDRLGLQTADQIQIIALQTIGGEIHTFLNPFPPADEYRRILTTLNEPVTYLVTMWKDGTLDIPSYDLRQKLIAADPRNADGRILLLGEGCLNVRSIDSTMKK